MIGLTNDRTYVFQVRAINREGGSDPAMVTVTPRPIPCSAPDLAGRTQIWTATITAATTVLWVPEVIEPHIGSSG